MAADVKVIIPPVVPEAEDWANEGGSIKQSPKEMEYRLVPREPTQGMYLGLARDIIMWRDMSNPTGKALHEHLKRSGKTMPNWLKAEIPDTSHVPSKGTVAVCIYKAMLDAAPNTDVPHPLKSVVHE